MNHQFITLIDGLSTIGVHQYFSLTISDGLVNAILGTDLVCMLKKIAASSCHLKIIISENNTL